MGKTEIHISSVCGLSKPAIIQSIFNTKKEEKELVLFILHTCTHHKHNTHSTIIIAKKELCSLRNETRLKRRDFHIWVRKNCVKHKGWS